GVISARAKPTVAFGLTSAACMVEWTSRNIVMMNNPYTNPDGRTISKHSLKGTDGRFVVHHMIQSHACRGTACLCSAQSNGDVPMTTPETTSQGTPQTGLPPGLALYRMAIGHYLSRALDLALRLELPDLVKDGPRDFRDLAQTTATHAPSLNRL